MKKTPGRWDLSAVPNVAILIWVILKSKKTAQKLLVIVGILETRRNMGMKKK
jgi:hypothetical protein